MSLRRGPKFQISASPRSGRTIAAVDLSSLARAAARGERDGAESLVRETLVDVWRFCRSQVGANDADDTTQDTYLRAWRSLSEGAAPDDVRAWLMTIAYRACADCIRRAERQRRRQDAIRAQPGETWGAPADEDLGLYDELLSVLGPDRRAAFVLTQLLGYTYAETAEICGTGVGTVRSRIARAREDLIRARQINLRQRWV
ncbi:MAG: sigma-70 family RNA polymerase sigma factor [Acidobacteriota bacterium]|nr:sigma-70 family RNA polymerase sigma factor [Acidobacteriota bacterium]